MQTAAQRGMGTVRYVIDTTASRFTVQAFATGLLSAFGHNPVIGIRDYDGEVQFVPDTYEKAFVHVSLRTKTVEVLDEMKSDDRKKLEQVMFEDLLEVDSFPEIVYESKQATVQKISNDLLNVHVSGDLQFHGVTQSQNVDARVTQMGSMLRMSGEFELRQSSYDIKPVSFAAGAVKLKDEHKFNFELVARRQD